METTEILRDWTIYDRNERQPDELDRDLKFVAKALKKEPDNEHLVFYLARLNQLQHRYAEAIQGYQKRIALGRDTEEVWCSKQMMGECYEALGQWEQALPIYMEAFQSNVNRAEPLHCLACYYRNKDNVDLAHLFALRGSTIPYPSDQKLFVSDPVYDYLLNEELSIASFYTPFKEDGLQATHRLILKSNVPVDVKEHAYRNLLFYLPTLPQATYSPVTPQVALNQTESCNSNEPLIVAGFSLDGEEPFYEFSRLRSSSSPIPWDNGRLLMVYETIDVDQQKSHIHYLMALDKQNNIKSISKPFFFQHKGVELSGKISIDGNKRELTIPVTFENDVMLATVGVESVQSLLEPIPPALGRYQVILQRRDEFDALKRELIHISKTEADHKNPFAIRFPPKDNLTHDDYETIQKELRKLDISSYLKSLYDTNYTPEVDPKEYTSFEDFESRCTKGFKQTMIDVEKNLLPIQKLEKIGNGSDMCIVSYSSYNKHYPDFLRDIPEALKNTGFNGYFYYRIGGYPNPTGQEARFSGVPYAFKIFMMLEAYRMGFTKIIWLDSAVAPLNDPTPLFSMVDQSETLFYGFQGEEFFTYILPSTRQHLKDLTGTDVLALNHVCGGIIGLNMKSKIVHDLIKNYYKFVAKGTPFLSCQPEECVLTAILGQPDYEKHHAVDWCDLLHWGTCGPESSRHLAPLKNEGYYFYLRRH